MSGTSPTFAQSSASISGSLILYAPPATAETSLVNCSFVGSVNGPTVTWQLQIPQANQICYTQRVRCSSGQEVDIEVMSGSFTGTVAGNQITGTNTGVSNVFDVSSRAFLGTYTGTSTLTVQR